MQLPAPITAEELPYVAPPNRPCELVRGVLRVSEPPGFLHGYIALRVAHRLATFVEGRRLGYVLAAETGFKIWSNPDTVRAPDVAFVAATRVQPPLPPGYVTIAPDLVVEVLSPTDRPGAISEKIADWLNAGCRLVWVLDPARRRARVWRANREALVVGADGTLDGEDVLPGFTLALAHVW